MQARAIFPLLALVVPLGSASLALAETYGQGLTLEDATPISTILADLDEWRGKRVQVTGTVSDVCPKKGCWMSLRDGEDALRIKVEDGVIVFPEAAKGHLAHAEGVVEVLEMDKDGYTSWLRHLAEERGEALDSGSVGEGPFQVVQIRGDGAEIEF